MSLAPVILAAGASRRLGQPKALADLGGQSALERLVEALLASSPPSTLAGGSRLLDRRPPLVITGHHDAEIRAHVARTGLKVESSFHRGWAQGRTSGVALAAELRPGSDLLICPVDVPLVGPALLRSLAEEWQRIGAPSRGWLAPFLPPRGDRIPRYGHPLVMGATLAERAAALVPDAPLRDLRHAAEPLASLETSDQAILDDLDTPGDLEALRRRLESQL